MLPSLHGNVDLKLIYSTKSSNKTTGKFTNYWVVIDNGLFIWYKDEIQIKPISYIVINGNLLINDKKYGTNGVVITFNVKANDDDIVSIELGLNNDDEMVQWFTSIENHSNIGKNLKLTMKEIDDIVNNKYLKNENFDDNFESINKLHDFETSLDDDETIYLLTNKLEVFQKSNINLKKKIIYMNNKLKDLELFKKRAIEAEKHSINLEHALEEMDKLVYLIETTPGQILSPNSTTNSPNPSNINSSYANLQVKKLKQEVHILKIKLNSDQYRIENKKLKDRIIHMNETFVTRVEEETAARFSYFTLNIPGGLSPDVTTLLPTANSSSRSNSSSSRMDNYRYDSRCRNTSNSPVNRSRNDKNKNKIAFGSGLHSVGSHSSDDNYSRSNSRSISPNRSVRSPSYASNTASSHSRDHSRGRSFSPETRYNNNTSYNSNYYLPSSQSDRKNRSISPGKNNYDSKTHTVYRKRSCFDDDFDSGSGFLIKYLNNSSNSNNSLNSKNNFNNTIPSYAKPTERSVVSNTIKTTNNERLFESKKTNSPNKHSAFGGGLYNVGLRYRNNNFNNNHNKDIKTKKSSKRLHLSSPDGRNIYEARLLDTLNNHEYFGGGSKQISKTVNFSLRDKKKNGENLNNNALNTDNSKIKSENTFPNFMRKTASNKSKRSSFYSIPETPIEINYKQTEFYSKVETPIEDKCKQTNNNQIYEENPTQKNIDFAEYVEEFRTQVEILKPAQQLQNMNNETINEVTNEEINEEINNEKVNNVVRESPILVIRIDDSDDDNEMDESHVKLKDEENVSTLNNEASSVLTKEIVLEEPIVIIDKEEHQEEENQAVNHILPDYDSEDEVEGSIRDAEDYGDDEEYDEEKSDDIDPADFRECVFMFSHSLGINIETEEYLFSIAEDALLNLPQGWEMGISDGEDNKIPYFSNEERGESIWTHPLQDFYINKVNEAREAFRSNFTDDIIDSDDVDEEYY
jgi:hypothetical protein